MLDVRSLRPVRNSHSAYTDFLWYRERRANADKKATDRLADLSAKGLQSLIDTWPPAVAAERDVYLVSSHPGPVPESLGAATYRLRAGRTWCTVHSERQRARTLGQRTSFRVVIVRPCCVVRRFLWEATEL